MRVVLVALALLAGLVAGCVATKAPAPPLVPGLTGTFVESGESAGLHDVVGATLHLPPSPRSANPMQPPAGMLPSDSPRSYGGAMTSLTGGVAAADLDSDGAMDLVFNQPGAVMVYANQGSGHFLPVPNAIPVPAGWTGTSVLAFDYDNDGRPDLLLGQSNGSVMLLHNEGSFRFLDASHSLGRDRDVPAEGAAAADINGDGYLDVLVVAYERWWNPDGPEGSGSRDRLYVNQGDGTFREEGLQWGINETRPSLSAAFGDYDGDGRQDLYVTNDFSVGAQLWHNVGHAFAEMTNQTGLASYRDGMGGVWADFNGDGRPDMYVSNIYAFLGGPPVPAGNQLFLNDGNGTFTDASLSSNAYNAGWAWGMCVLDAESDGDLDLLVPSGFPAPGVPAPPLPGVTPREPLPMDEMPQHFFLNHGNATFDSAETEWGVADAMDGRGCATVDVDNDGAQDVVVVGLGHHPMLYLNRHSQGHGIDLLLRGTGHSNRDAVGAYAIASWPGGQERVERAAGGGYLSTSSPVLHLGIGSQTHATVKLVWPDGTTQSQDLAAGRYRWTQGEAPRPW